VQETISLRCGMDCEVQYCQYHQNFTELLKYFHCATCLSSRSSAQQQISISSTLNRKLCCRPIICCLPKLCRHTHTHTHTRFGNVVCWYIYKLRVFMSAGSTLILFKRRVCRHNYHTFIHYPEHLSCMHMNVKISVLRAV
jgi:hypothetical protein